MPLPRFRIRTLMIVVAVVAVACYGGNRFARWRECRRLESNCRCINRIPILDPIPGEPTESRPE